MLDQKIQDAFNKQLNAEAFSSYLYLSMAAWFESRNLVGMAAWMRVQSQEETGHAMKFLDHISKRNGRVALAQIDAPKAEWGSALEAFEEAYKHECKITGMIHKLVELAGKEKDYAANAFLQWFVNEQVEEEASVLLIVERLKLLGASTGGLLMLDKELGKRGEGKS
jgi:ferritin